MKKFKIFAMLLSLACATGFVACDDDDAVKQELQSPSVSGTFSNYQSLDFEWNAVANTIQYGYKLFAPDGSVVKAGVTKNTSAKFSKLQPATTYTLKVWAFAGLDTDYSTSPAAELTATTAALVKLATPANLTVTDNGGAMEASWDAVENAMTYSYTISSAEEVVNSGSVSATTLRISGLEEGDYTISVTATTTKGGYISSDPATANFRFEVKVSELWRAAGTYYSNILNDSWNITLIAYNDGTYSIPAFYGVDGYDFNFTVDADGIMTILSGEPNGKNYRTVPTGVAAAGDLFVYLSDYSFTGFDGDSKGGDIWIGYYDQDWSDTFYTDTFNWTGSTSGGSTSMTVDNLAGTYSNHIWGWSYLENDNWDEEEIDHDNYVATISKIDDKTVSVDGIYYTDCPVIGTVDFSTMTITFQPQEYATYYTFAGYDVSDPVIGKIAGDGSITLEDVTLWSDGYWYLYATSVLTPQNGTRATAGHYKSAVKKAPRKVANRKPRK